MSKTTTVRCNKRKRSGTSLGRSAKVQIVGPLPSPPPEESAGEEVSDMKAPWSPNNQVNTDSKLKIKFKIKVEDSHDTPADPPKLNMLTPDASPRMPSRDEDSAEDLFGLFECPQNLDERSERELKCVLENTLDELNLESEIDAELDVGPAIGNTPAVEPLPAPRVHESVRWPLCELEKPLTFSLLNTLPSTCPSEPAPAYRLDPTLEVKSDVSSGDDYFDFESGSTEDSNLSQAHKVVPLCSYRDRHTKDVSEQAGEVPRKCLQAAWSSVSPLIEPSSTAAYVYQVIAAATSIKQVSLLSGRARQTITEAW